MSASFPQLLWHYTIKDRLAKILRDRVIRLAHAGWDQGERLAVWFSANPLWEPTAAKLFPEHRRYVLSLQEHFDCSTNFYPGVQPARIGVAPETAPYRWNDFKRMSGVSAKVAKALYAKGLALQSRPGEWYVSFEPVPLEQWLSVQLYNGSEWVVLQQADRDPRPDSPDAARSGVDGRGGKEWTGLRK